MKIAIISVYARSLVGFRGPLIRSLLISGIEVFALASDYDDVTRSAVSAIGAKPIDISMKRTGMNPFADMRDLWRLIYLLRQLKPDVVLGYYIKPAIFGTIAAWLAHVPRRIPMIEGLGFIFTDDGKSPSIKKIILRFFVSQLYRFALCRAHKVIFLNPDDISDFDRWGICPREKTFDLGGIGVDLHEWSFSPPRTARICFLFIGRLLAEKGIYDFISAARIVKAKYSSVDFIVLGSLDSNLGGISKVQIQTWVDEGLVSWPGEVDVKPWIRQSSVFVLPSYREGVPRSSQEAMAMGRPVITTDVPGCRETVEHGVNGLLVPMRDPAALAGAMLRFIQEPNLIPRMGIESRRIAEERFDVHKVNRRLIEILAFRG